MVSGLGFRVSGLGLSLRVFMVGVGLRGVRG